jgi:hypothetical protein
VATFSSCTTCTSPGLSDSHTGLFLDQRPGWSARCAVGALPALNTWPCVYYSGMPDPYPGTILAFWITPPNASCCARWVVATSSLTGSCLSTWRRWNQRQFLMRGQSRGNMHSPGYVNAGSRKTALEVSSARTVVGQRHGQLSEEEPSASLYRAELRSKNISSLSDLMNLITTFNPIYRKWK